MAEALSVEARIELGPDGSEGRFEFVDNPHVIAFRREVLLEPYYEAAEVRARLGRGDIDPPIADGTLLTYTDHGARLFPGFQFNPDTGQPYEIIQRVNILSGRRSDGWVVTSWWITKQRFLKQAPKTLLSDPREVDELYDAARADMVPPAPDPFPWTR